MFNRYHSNSRYESNSSSSSSSSSSTNTSWLNSSSEDTEEEVELFNGPEPKKLKRNNSTDKNFVESEMNYEYVLRAHYKWTVKDFSKICKERKIGEKLESPTFTIGNNEELKWCIQLYPKGLNEQAKYFVTVFLQLVSSKEPRTKVTYDIKCLHYTSDEPIKEEYCSQGQRVGIKRFVRTETLLRTLKLQDNDRLTFRFTINVHLSKKPVNKVVNDLAVLLESGDYSDVTLDVGEKKFRVHKYILAARSPVFFAMFNHDMKENQENVVKITDTEHSVMKEIIRFIYTGEVDNLATTAKYLLAAADKYALEDLKAICENALCGSLNVNNVVEILKFAELHSAVKLKEQALQYFVSHVKEVVNTPSFKVMGNSQSPLLTQVICMMAAQKKS